MIFLVINIYLSEVNKKKDYGILSIIYQKAIDIGP